MGCRTLDELCELIVDCPHSSAKDEGVGYPMVRTPNIGMGRLNLQGVHRVSRAVYEKRVARAIPQANDLILAREAPVGNVAIVPDGAQVCLGQRTMLLRPKTDEVVPSYLAYHLSAPEQRTRLLGMANGATIAHINVADVRSFEVDLPPLCEQRRVAAVLQSIDEKIEINSKLNGYLEELVALEFERQFGADCPTTELENVLDISTKALKPQEHTGEMWEHYSIPAFDGNHRPVVELADGIKSSKYVIDSDCILISKLNPSTKRVWLPACRTSNSVCSTEFIVYRPKVSKYRSFYFSVISSKAFTDYLLAHVSGSTGSRQRVQPKSTLGYPMPNPGAHAIEEYCEFADPLYKQMQLNEVSSQQLEKLRDTLLPKLMSGEVDVSKVDVTQLNSHLA